MWATSCRCPKNLHKNSFEQAQQAGEGGGDGDGKERGRADKTAAKCVEHCPKRIEYYAATLEPCPAISLPFASTHVCQCRSRSRSLGSRGTVPLDRMGQLVGPSGALNRANVLICLFFWFLLCIWFHQIPFRGLALWLACNTSRMRLFF